MTQVAQPWAERNKSTATKFQQTGARKRVSFATFMLIIFGCMATTAYAQTNIAPNGTGYVWHSMASSTAITGQTASAGVNDGNLTTGVSAYPAGESSQNMYEGAGVIFSSAQTTNKVSFINGTIDSGGNGFFEANVSLQTSTNGTSWTNVSGWTLSPAYPYSTSAGGKTYTFTGPAISGVKGVRVVGMVRSSSMDWSWYWIVNEIQIFASAATPTPTPTPSPTPACTSTTITPYIQVNDGSWQQTSSAAISAGASVNLGPQPTSGGSWSWTGPNGYTSASRQIGITVNSTSTYTATYTNACGSNSTQAFVLTVPAPTPTPTPATTATPAPTATSAPTATATATPGSGNIAPGGTGYIWHSMAGTTATTGQTANTGVNDGNLTTGVVVYPSGEASQNLYEGAGVIFGSAQTFNKVSFINGAIDGGGNGFFEANLTLQTSANGTSWTNVSGWALSPAYPYSSSAGGQTYTFTGPTISAMGVRVVGMVRSSSMDWSWYWIVNEVQIFGGSGSGSGGPGLVAPYVDMGMGAPYNDVPTMAQAAGLKYVTMAFVGANGTACKAAWDGGSTVSSDSTFGSYVTALRNNGGDAIISFGGESGYELADECSGVSALQTQYQSVINKYGVTRLDFDIEYDNGDSIDNTAAIDLRNQTLAALQTANPNLILSYTLPVDVSGLESNALYVLQSALKYGVKISLVNIMTMDYGSPANPSTEGQNAISSANNTLTQLNNIGMNAKVGIIALIGWNDTYTSSYSEQFTLSDAQTVVNYAKGNSSIGMLSFWSLARDQQCPSGTTPAPDLNTCSSVAQSPYQFSQILEQY